jgi:hypothetical protein
MSRVYFLAATRALDVRVVYGERPSLAIVKLPAGSAVPEHQHRNEQLAVPVPGWPLADVPYPVWAGPLDAKEAFAPHRRDRGLGLADDARVTWPE